MTEFGANNTMITLTNNNIIELTRGDTEVIPIPIFYSSPDLINISYFPGRYDKIFFAVMGPHQKFEDAIIKKIYYYNDINQRTGVINIKLESIDTQFLRPGTYYYTVKVLKKGMEDVEDCMGRIETVISNRKFIIKE